MKKCIIFIYIKKEGKRVRYKVIDNKRLNVYLTKKDLQKENVTIDDIVDGSEKSVVRIKKIFKVISKLAKFNINNQALNIVLMPIVDGDLIISAGIAEFETALCKYEVFVFESFENVLDACFVMKGYKILSSLYFMEKKYYIIVHGIDLYQKYYENLCTIYKEYGEKSEISPYYLEEHGKNIIKNHAIEVLTAKFL